MKLLSICFTTTVNQADIASKTSIIPGKFTSDVSINVIITCQCVFVPVPAFADYFSSLVQHVVSIWVTTATGPKPSKMGNSIF